MTFAPLPNTCLLEAKTYAPVGRCIYCGAKRYDSFSKTLSLEHIIPEGLGGKYELPEASCRKCAVETGRVEQTCLRGFLWPLRSTLGIKGKRGRKYPSAFPIEYRSAREAIDKTILTVAASDLPVLAHFVQFRDPPLILTGGFEVSTVVRFPFIEREPGAKVPDGVLSLSIPVIPFVRMLAKIAHSYATGEAGHGNFKPVLQGLIRTGRGAWRDYIGGDPDHSKLSSPPRSEYMHHVHLYIQKHDDVYFLIVDLQLFGFLSAPIYQIVVGYPSQELIDRTLHTAQAESLL